MNRVHELIQKYLDDLASDAESAELARLLADSPEAADVFARATRTEAALDNHFHAQVQGGAFQLLPAPSANGIVPEPVVTRSEKVSGPFSATEKGPDTFSTAAAGTRQRQGRRGGWSWLAAAVVLLATGATLFYWFNRSEASANEVVSGEVLVDGQAVTRIPDGARAEIAGDAAAVISLPDGSRAELAPASEVVLRGRVGKGGQVIELERGSGKFLVDKRGRQFRVDTPAGSIIALGTEFAVELRPAEMKGEESMSGNMSLILAVTVLLGQVEVRSGGQSHVLSFGESRTFAAEVKDTSKKNLLTGKVVAVSADGTVITLEGLAPKKGNEPTKTEIKLTNKTKVTYYGVEKGADKPTVGYLATVLLADGSTDTALRVEFGTKEPHLIGRVADVSADGKRLTLEIARKNEPTTRTEIKLTERTRLGYLGVEKDGEKPTVDYLALVWVKEGAKDTAVEVQFSDKKKVAKGEKGEPQPDFTAKVIDVSADGKTITLEVPSKIKGEEPAKVVVKMNGETKVGYSGVEEKPTVGYFAVAWLVKGSKEDLAIIKFAGKKIDTPKKGEKGEKAPDLVGVINAVAEDNKSITLEVPSKKVGEKALVEIKFSERTKFAYTGTEEQVKVAVGQQAAVWLEEGSKDVAAGLQYGNLKGAAVNPPKENKDPNKPEPKKEPAKDNPDKETPASGAALAPRAPAEPRVARPSAPVTAAIDRELDKRLAEAKVPASPLADDAEFLRRVYLDITGRIPTREKTVAFLDSKDPDKRAKLIDELLASPNYGQHFATIWNNLMAPRDLTNPKAKTGTLTGWLTEQFNRDQGWNQIVYDLLTAEGELARNPQTGFIMANSENQQPQADLLAASSSRLFLGVQLQCAQCHNHPFASWKQSDFWGTAAFFSRVRNTSSKGQGPVALTEIPAGTNDKGGKGGASGFRTAPGGAIVIGDSSGKGAGTVIKARFPGGQEQTLDDEKPFRPAFATWMTAADNPYFANAAINRLWGHFFGRGLVNPVDNFRADHPPSHPELLKLLADEFKASGYDNKHLIRCLCNSQAYQRTSKPLPENQADTQLFSRMTIKVMSPEVFYDSLLIAMNTNPATRSGPRPNQEKGKGPPLEAREEFIRFFSTQGDSAEASEFSHGIPQFLRRMNAEQFNNGAPIVDRLANSGAAREQILEGLYLATLSRRPTAKEVELMSAYLARRPDPSKAYGGVLWILLNSSEFVLNH